MFPGIRGFKDIEQRWTCRSCAAAFEDPMDIEALLIRNTGRLSRGTASETEKSS